ncbi:phosphate signaling complex protein PhoU [bacterium]|nr:phosphate signaling complex protein PhoU [bacterium]
MSFHFQRDLEQLRKKILGLGAMVEDALSKAVQALVDRDDTLAREVIRDDAEIDHAEIEVEEDCLKILALYQPVAQDLRFIVAVLKMNNDLERMGDHAANVAKRARFIARRDPIQLPPDIVAMSENVKTMLKHTLDALINRDADLARKVCAADDAVDRQKREIADMVRARIYESTDDRESLLKLLDIPRHLERIADLATNISEDVVYMIEGSIIRHHHADEG